MNTDLVRKIKNLTIIALASDDNLVETLVLKGGNAIELIYKSNSVSRASYDLDYSIEHGDFMDYEAISERIKKTLEQTFLENDYIILDYKFMSKPKKVNEKISEFWGGYKVEFKVIEKAKFDVNKSNVDAQRRNAISLYADNSTVFDIEFSKFEYIGQKTEVSIDGYKLFVYTPVMIVLEKLRAICQQLPQYKDVIPSFTPRPRAKDFYDIFLIMEMHSINTSKDEIKELLKNIFSAKKVPLEFIQQIKNNRNLHKDDWSSVIDTVSAKEDLREFDFYFDYVLSKFENLTIL